MLKIFITLLILFSGVSKLWCRVLMTQEQALKLAFPSDVKVERKTIFLSDEQKKAIEQRAKSKLDSKIVTTYIGRNNKNAIQGYAFFNSHKVRTMPESLMVVVDPSGQVRSVEMLAFYEPEDYLPPQKWLGLFQNKPLNDEMWVKRGIRNVTGATLTTQAITEAVRRSLATWEVALKDMK